MNKEHVYLLGKGDGWEAINDVPKGSIIYGVNDACLRTPEVTHTFHMHDLKDFGKNKVTESSTRLMKLHCEKYPKMPLYSVRRYKDFPNIILYPLEDIVDYFKLPMAYFSSGPEYMIAWALREGFKEMTLYGLNMTVSDEYKDQKPGMEFWLGIALGMGVKVNLQHDKSSLLKCRDSKLYGYFMKQWRVY
jgi:hypothetical protein